MKRYLKIGVILTSAFIVISGCSSKKAPVSLEKAGTMTEEQLKQELAGFSHEEIVDAWGEGAVSLSGLFGDVYQLDERKTLVLYYESDGRAIQDVKFGEVSQKFEGTIEEVHGFTAVVAVDEGFPIYNSGNMVSVVLDENTSAAQVGDRVRVSYSGAAMETYPLQLENQISIELIAKEEYDPIPMVMLDGCLYQSTGEISDVEGRCGMMDGEIETSVDGSEIPSENGQSNFGSGYGYQYVGENGIDIYMPYGNPDEWQWIRFEKSGLENLQNEPSVIKTYEVTDSEQAFEDDELVTMVKYYEMSDGTWRTDTQAYKYRLEITGRLGGAVKDSTFVFLSNLENITFEQAWKASGLSSNMNDYFKEEDAKLVAFR